MNVSKEIRMRAKKHKKTIVFPEGEELRIIQATQIIINESIANPVLLGKKDNIKKIAKENNIDLPEELKVINPKESDKLHDYSNVYYNLRKNKGISLDESLNFLTNPLYFGALMVYQGDADGLVAGSINATGDVFRPALQIIKTSDEVKIVSSSFIMVVPDCEYGENGVLVFADCAIFPEPNAEELADIAIASAKTAKMLLDFDPKIAMLSFSTKGSAKHKLVDKVVQATNIVKEKAPYINIDGELQADAALIPDIGKKKAPGSKIAGSANVLIFPDLQAANIGYKLVQRLAKAEAIGPITQGMRKPVNDLSRGCTAKDIVNVTAITVLQSQGV